MIVDTPLVIGVTGGIGAGKSTVVDAFARRGAVVFSADDAVHRLYGTDDVRDAVVDRWGDRVLDDESGAVDRSRIADIVFHDEAELRWLEGLLHPLVAREWVRFVHEQGERDEPPLALVAEVPLLFEAGLKDRYGITVLVTAPLDVRLARVGDRARGSSHAEQRAAQQMGDDEKRVLADFEYVNDGDVSDIAAFVDEVLDKVAAR